MITLDPTGQGRPVPPREARHRAESARQGRGSCASGGGSARIVLGPRACRLGRSPSSAALLTPREGVDGAALHASTTQRASIFAPPLTMQASASTCSGQAARYKSSARREHQQPPTSVDWPLRQTFVHSQLPACLSPHFLPQRIAPRSSDSSFGSTADTPRRAAKRRHPARRHDGAAGAGPASWLIRRRRGAQGSSARALEHICACGLCESGHRVRPSAGTGTRWPAALSSSSDRAW